MDGSEDNTSTASQLLTCISHSAPFTIHQHPPPSAISHLDNPYRSHHRHDDSSSTHRSESRDSSPTSTMSTADSIPMIDSTPSSPPESPLATITLPAFASSSFPFRSSELTGISNDSIPERHVKLPHDRPMSSPSARRHKNMKGLALNLPNVGDSTTTSSEQCSPGPLSPSAFVIPPKMKLRNKSGVLSLQTTNPAALAVRRPGNIAPPTPGLAGNPMLRHHHSSPHITSSTPGLAPRGGMRLPGLQRSSITGLSSTFRKPSGMSQSSSVTDGLDSMSEEDSPITTQLATWSLDDTRGGDVFDAPRSQEDCRSPSYPDGPVEIYAPNVFLYLEPSAAEALKFDVIINVASEVKNPFETSRECKPSVPSRHSIGQFNYDRDDIDEPSTAMSTATFRTAFEWQPESEVPIPPSPATPRACAQQPEYIHVPWEHNTDISSELMNLCELIENRDREGKRILVHCQQGASRSASLIIAYGMYKNPDMTVNDAYVAAQKKSRWISPNMKLMYALQEFRKLVNQRFGVASRRINGGRSPSKQRLTLSADVEAMSNIGAPLTAPLPAHLDTESIVSGCPPVRARGNSTPNLELASTGLSSALSRLTWIGTKSANPEAMDAANEIGHAGGYRKPFLVNRDQMHTSESKQPLAAVRPSSREIAAFEFGFEGAATES